MTFTLGHQNIEQPDRSSDELKTIDAVHDHCDVVTWNEARDATSAIRGLLGWRSVFRSGLAISWKTAKFDLVDWGHRRVMQGGHVGADGTRKGPDNRRVGPSRYVLWAALREETSGRLLILATHHAVARADTKHKWRRSLRSKGFAGVVAELRFAKNKFPAAKLILTGDLNTVGRIAAFTVLGIREAKTPATYGKRLRYDRIFGSVSNIRTLRTRSDHRALLATVTLTGEPTPAPKPPEPTPPKEEPVATSVNGNPVLFEARTAGSLPRLRKWIIPGANRHLLVRDGAMGFLLIHFALWWHDTIGRLDAPGSVWDEWGWAVRPVRGQTTGFSNHASGTAIDLDATRHPIGVSVSKTFSALQRVRIAARIRWYRGCLAWGGAWRRPDGMHVEVSAGLSACEKRARALLNTKRGKRILAANPGAKEVILS